MLVIGAAALAGCGSSSSPSGGGTTSNPTGGTSAKPAYCTAVGNLESSIRALPSTDVVKEGTSALESAVARVKQNAQTVVEAAKSEFPSQTSALKSSADALASTVEQIVHAPTTALISQLPGQVSAVATAAKNLESATASRCR